MSSRANTPSTPSRLQPRRGLAAASVAASCLGLAQLAGPAAAGPVLSLCANPGGPVAPIRHVIVVVLENQSFPAVVGRRSKAPYQNGTLARQCGLASQMYADTHTSAANYLAMSAGNFPAVAVRGCGTGSACASATDNLYRQLDATGGWKAYQESMPSSCYGGPATHYRSATIRRCSTAWPAAPAKTYR